MSDDAAFERATSDWLEAGSDRTPPEVLDAVLLAVRTTPQERDLRIPWMVTPMPTYLRLVAAVAIVAIAGVTGLTYLNGRPELGAGGGAMPSPTQLPTPSPSPTAEPSPTTNDLAGTYRFEDEGEFEGRSWTVELTPEGRFTVKTPDGDVDAGGTYRVEGQRMIIEDDIAEIGELCPGTGTYAIEFTGGRLAMEKIEDPCQGRAEAWTSGWTKEN
jgi:hypothetical protein